MEIALPHVTASAHLPPYPTGTSKAPTSRCRNSTPSRLPASSAAFLASPTNSSEMSMPSTRPPSPTFAAATKATFPVPVARSRTEAPGLMAGPAASTMRSGPPACGHGVVRFSDVVVEGSQGGNVGGEGGRHNDGDDGRCFDRISLGR
ncbi:hypothetical protein PMIN02_006124 [Paraphaeosphaeria minitans]